MPVLSRSQFRLFQAVAHGAKLKNKPKGLSKATAKEFVDKSDYSELPERKSKLKKMYKKD